MVDYVADTHTLIWYLEDSPRLGDEARRAFEVCDRGEGNIFIPTICLVEIVYLNEKGRIPTHLKKKLDNENVNTATGLVFVDLTVEIANLVAEISRKDIPDMPDRIIAATALHLGLPLITRDKKITVSNLKTIW